MLRRVTHTWCPSRSPGAPQSHPHMVSLKITWCSAESPTHGVPQDHLVLRRVTHTWCPSRSPGAPQSHPHMVSLKITWCSAESPTHGVPQDHLVLRRGTLIYIYIERRPAGSPGAPQRRPAPKVFIWCPAGTSKAKKKKPGGKKSPALSHHVGRPYKRPCA